MAAPSDTEMPWHEAAVSLIKAVAQSKKPPIVIPDKLTPAQVNLLVHVDRTGLTAKLSTLEFAGPKTGGGAAPNKVRSRGLRPPATQNPTPH